MSPHLRPVLFTRTRNRMHSEVRDNEILQVLHGAKQELWRPVEHLVQMYAARCSNFRAGLSSDRRYIESQAPQLRCWGKVSELSELSALGKRSWARRIRALQQYWPVFDSMLVDHMLHPPQACEDGKLASSGQFSAGKRKATATCVTGRLNRQYLLSIKWLAIRHISASC